MAIDPAPSEAKQLLHLLRTALRSIETHCRRGLLPRDAPAILRHLRAIRAIADDLEGLSGQRPDYSKPDERFRTMRGVSRHPEDENK